MHACGRYALQKRLGRAYLSIQLAKISSAAHPPFITRTCLFPSCSRSVHDLTRLCLRLHPPLPQKELHSLLERFWRGREAISNSLLHSSAHKRTALVLTRNSIYPFQAKATRPPSLIYLNLAHPKEQSPSSARTSVKRLK